MNTQQKALLIGVALTTWAWISSGEYDDEIENEMRHYCSMISIYKETGGEYGWPPFKPEIQCKKPRGN